MDPIKSETWQEVLDNRPVTQIIQVVSNSPETPNSQINISIDTLDLLQGLQKEIMQIYWEEMSLDDCILYLYSYYCRKPAISWIIEH